MNHEQLPQPAQQKSSEIFGFTENEQLFSRVNEERFQELILDDQTLIHNAKDSGNSFGDFLFVTVSRPGEKERISMTFYGLGYHEYRERLIKDEWFWYPTSLQADELEKTISKPEFAEMLQKRMDNLPSMADIETQSQQGALFEILADLTDEDGALAEMEDIEFTFADFFGEQEMVKPPEAMPLMNENIRQSLPELYSQEEKGLDALAKVKYFTPDSNWTWYATEFDGKDTFFGLVNGFELELGYFTLSELQQACGPKGLPIERDMFFEQKSLKELMDKHRQERCGGGD
jgi:hypothetical protein